MTKWLTILACCLELTARAQPAPPPAIHRPVAAIIGVGKNITIVYATFPRRLQVFCNASTNSAVRGYCFYEGNANGSWTNAVCSTQPSALFTNLPPTGRVWFSASATNPAAASPLATSISFLARSSGYLIAGTGVLYTANDTAGPWSLWPSNKFYLTWTGSLSGLNFFVRGMVRATNWPVIIP